MDNHSTTSYIPPENAFNERFEKYQRFTEQTIYNLSKQITFLEKKINIFTNLLEISNYINQYINSQELLPLINDMLIGIFGTKYSTIYIKSGDSFIHFSSSNSSNATILLEEALIAHHNEEDFVLNSQTPIYANSVPDSPSATIYSCLGVPIKINNKSLGFILIQHHQKDYFSKDHSTFLSLLANHIGVAIENNFLYNQIRESACKDGLTNIFNKKHFFDTLQSIPNIENLNYCLIMIDIDNFKVINDTYGHPYGDIVLKEVCSIIKINTRANDIVARYGGEEIIIFMNNFTTQHLIIERAERIRSQIEQALIFGDGFSSSVTVSLGIYIKADECLSLDEVINRADNNLYACKHSGKNKYVIS